MTDQAQVDTFFSRRQQELRKQLQEAEQRAEELRRKLAENEEVRTSLGQYLSRPRDPSKAQQGSRRDSTLQTAIEPEADASTRRRQAPKRRKGTRIMRILALVHQTPGGAWTVREMTEALGLNPQEQNLVRESLEYLRRKSELVKDHGPEGRVRYTLPSTAVAPGPGAEQESEAGIA